MVSKPIVIGVLLLGALASVDAQWLNHAPPGIPRTSDGKPNLFAPAPRTSDGKPDLSGIWQVEPPPPGEIDRLFCDSAEVVLHVPGDDLREFPRFFVNILVDFKPEEVSLLPGAARKTDGPPSVCEPGTVPGIYFIPLPFRIVQTPALLAILHEPEHTFRQIHTDGRKLPVDPQPSWLGYSVGRWEGRTLVVDT